MFLCGNPADCHCHRASAPKLCPCVSSRRGPDERLKRLDELREIPGNHLPDDVLVHAEVVVHDLVPHPDDVLP